MDLMMLTKYQSTNIPNFYTDKNYNVFCAVDINSRLGFALPLKDKTAQTVQEAIRQLVQTYDLKFNRRVKYIESDQGSEFNNYLVQAYLKNPYDGDT